MQLLNFIFHLFFTFSAICSVKDCTGPANHCHIASVAIAAAIVVVASTWQDTLTLLDPFLGPSNHLLHTCPAPDNQAFAGFPLLARPFGALQRLNEFPTDASCTCESAFS